MAVGVIIRHGEGAVRPRDAIRVRSPIRPCRDTVNCIRLKDHVGPRDVINLKEDCVKPGRPHQFATIAYDNLRSQNAASVRPILYMGIIYLCMH